ncbi:MAG: type VII toxin-antitoxin system HepT family RNase toxin [Opitutales bacterium]
MDRDIILRKLDSLARCVERLEQKRPAKLDDLIDEVDLQDILSINLERAVQLCVDVGAHLIADFEVPPPQTMGEVFDILVTEGLISAETGSNFGVRYSVFRLTRADGGCFSGSPPVIVYRDPGFVKTGWQTHQGGTP